MGLLDGKVALITGAARGQGRAHAVTCAREGADVVLLDIADQIPTVTYKLADATDFSQTVAEVEAHGGGVIAVTADIRDQEALDNAVTQGIKAFGHIDILIANAGIVSLAPFWELTDEQWDVMIGVTLTGTWKSVKAVAPHMIERGEGSIVITSSMNGIEAAVNYAHYVAAKHGLLGLMKAMALELAPHNVRCNAICPAAVNTKMVNNPDLRDMIAGHENATEAEFLESGYHNFPLRGRTFLSPQVIADTALFLNSSLAESVTGVSIPVDAGHGLLPGLNMSPIRD